MLTLDKSRAVRSGNPHRDEARGVVRVVRLVAGDAGRRDADDSRHHDRHLSTRLQSHQFHSLSVNRA